MTGLRAAATIALMALTARPLAAAGDANPADVSWLDGLAAKRSFADVSRTPARAVGIGQQAVIALPSRVEFRGALYDTLIVGPDLGLARLAWRGTDDPSAAPAGPMLLMRPLGNGLQPGFEASIQVRTEGSLVAVRWTGLRDAFGQPASFDVLVEPSGTITYQYLQVPPTLRWNPVQAGILLENTGCAGARVEPSAEGFRLASGGLVVFPPNMPSQPKTGCGVAPNWCTVVQARDQFCITPGDGDETSCASTDEQRWHFNEGEFCRSCPYTFYVTVECGTEMHLPFLDMEGNQIQVTDVFTGVQLELEALNDCAKRRFRYCNACPGAAGIYPEPVGGCGGTPTIPCIPYLQHSTLIQWGYPFTDTDGDTVFDDLPCGPPSTTECGGSGAYAGFEETNTDVILHGSPALCGVFRLDVLSGGFHWFLSANCTGIVPRNDADIARNFHVYLNCSDALSAFDPLPELVITELDFTGVCPDIVLNLEVTNIGCTDTASSPIHVAFDRPQPSPLDVDLGPIAAGTSTRTSFPLTLVTTPVTATAAVDPANVIAECTEQPAGSFSGCQPTNGSDTMTARLCVCRNTVHVGVTQDQVSACGLAPVLIDASPSFAVPCTSGMEWRFLDDTGLVLQDWSPSWRYSYSPPYCPSLREFVVEGRCAAEIGRDCVGSTIVDVECQPQPSVTLQARPTEICWGESTTLMASPGLVSYTWSDGQVGRIIVARPLVTTTYRVDARDSYGCVATAEVTITVNPDPLPGSLGNTLRARKQGSDVLFSYQELPVPVSGYELVCHAPNADVRPCPTFRPPGSPLPLTMDAALVVATSLPGATQPALDHVGGVFTCPDLLFYLVRGLSACTRTPGPTCDGWPHQIPPCP